MQIRRHRVSYNQTIAPTTDDTTRNPKRMGWDWGGSGGGPLGRWWPGSGGSALGVAETPTVSRRAVSFGYHPDLPDLRDLCIDVQRKNEIPEAVEEAINQIKELNARSGGKKKLNAKQLKEESAKYKSFLLRESNDLPKSYDLRLTGYFSPVEDQREIGSCTAQAVIGMVEYLMYAGGSGQPDMSRMFLYKTTRRLLGLTGDTGAYLRTTIKAMALFGVPTEETWPYDADLLDAEPEAYHYSYAQNFKALVYTRLDGYGSGSGGERTLDTIKRTLADGFPVAFGFPVYSSIDSVGPGNRYVIPFPQPELGDSLLGGHAVLAVGYDDEWEVGVVHGNAPVKGALIIRNSWGEAWGERGYAYLPYAYVTEELAVDFWSIFNRDWIRLERFG